MIDVGRKAPDFSRPGVAEEIRVYDLRREIDRGRVVLLAFYPADFLAAPTAELRAIEAAGWHAVDGLAVWGLSGDSVFAHAAYADRHGISFPLLSDFHAGVAGAYDVRYDDWEVHGPAPRRAYVLVDADWEVRHAWSTDDTDATSKPSPLASVAESLDALIDERIDPGIQVDY